MPSLSISTNVPLEGVNTSDVLSELGKAVAKIIGKPEAANHHRLTLHRSFLLSFSFSFSRILCFYGVLMDLTLCILQYVMVQVKGSVAISFGGTLDPAAYGELVSIGGLGSDTNKKLSAAIANVLESKLAVSKTRFYIKFYDVKRSDFGWNGTTF